MDLLKISLPGSKSITNRCLLLAALSNGTSILRNVLRSDDTLYMLSALKTIGISILETPEYIQITGRQDLDFAKGKEFEIFVGNAGTTIRFLTAYFSFLEGATITLTCEPRMRERPIKDLVEPLKEAGADITYLGKEGYPPLKIRGKNFSFSEITLDGSQSSQYISAMLMLLPAVLPHAKIKVSSLVSLPYIDTTLETMKRFQVVLKNQDYALFQTEKGLYRATEITIPADASSASYFWAGAFLQNKPLQLNIGSSCMQGDFLFIDILRQMGGSFAVDEKETVFIARNPSFAGISVDMNAIPDTVQTLACLSLFASSPTHIHNIANLRIKETDRIQALENELKKIGAEVLTTKDSLSIFPKEPSSYKSVSIETYQDHRMAMSFAVAQLRIPELVIQNPSVVSKSFPEFFTIWEKIKEREKK